ncbi:MAG: YraN family protein [Arcanobacterium sp.]|nr:YraN family protein [Arcanobacterium sp.]
MNNAVLPQPQHQVFLINLNLRPDSKDIFRISRRELGVWGENRAASFLEMQGFKILARNWRCTLGELDLVIYHPKLDSLRAVEVKTRRTNRFGSGKEAVTAHKLITLRVLLSCFLKETEYSAKSIGIDVVSISRYGASFYLEYLPGVDDGKTW